jgi:ubiquinone/menaquinone biosynthesis C-methylase UbiE
MDGRGFACRLFDIGDIMNEESSKPDWSDKRWRDMLVFQRKSMWFDDTVEKFAAWLGLQQGMTAVDVGCGLGHMGYTYWPYYGKGGEYIGVDKNEVLLRDAEEAASDWAGGGKTRFIVGDAYHLPLPDNSADIVMCQALLMHLPRPEQALSEMIRIAKPDGIIFCHEPDNQNPRMGQLYNSLPESEIDDHLLCVKVYMICHLGRIKLGNGDNAVGPKIPHMMKTLGLKNIEVRLNDRVHYLEPPYAGRLQQDALNHIKEMIVNKDRYQMLRGREKKEFIAGGGDMADYEKYLKIEDKYIDRLREQVKEEKYFACAAGALYTIKGQKGG